MSLRKYKRIKYLGKGSYGAAILVNLRANAEKKFVMKEIVIGHLSESEQAAAKKEADVLHKMQHSNITMYIESFVESSKLYIVMEFADGGDLANAISNRKKQKRYWQEDEVMRILVQICLALKHVHDQNILHRDLKSQNIFLTRKGIVKLGDFGIAKVLDATEEQAKTQIGTPYYLSPEICESSPYGRSSDVWSLGVVLFELLCLDLPFQASSLPALISRIITAPPNWNKVPGHYSKSITGLTQSMLEKQPKSRPSLKQVVSTEFLKSHISKLLSHTLRNKNGGALSDAAENIHQHQVRNGQNGNEKPFEGKQGAGKAIAGSKEGDRMANEVEQLYAAQREREQEVKEEHLVSDRQAHREREREKLRRFRQEMILKKQHGEPSSQNRAGDDDDNNPFKLPASRYGERGGASEAQRRKEWMVQKKVDPPRYEDAVSNEIVPSSNIPRKKASAQRDEDTQKYIRQQFFANRRAAAAVKARVEAEERGGVGHQPQELDHVETSVALQRQPPASFEQQVGGARIRSGAEWSSLDAEKKIAELKQKSRLDKERRIAEKEEQLKLAHEANQEERRRLSQLREGGEDKEQGGGDRVLLDRGDDDGDDYKERDISRKAIAFDIDLAQRKGKSKPPSIGGTFDRDHLDDEIDTSNDGSNVVLKRLRERRAREREAREKAKLVFKRLQEQRKIQQRVHNDSHSTKHDAHVPVKPVGTDMGAEDDAELDETLKKFLVVPSNVTNAPPRMQEEKSESIFSSSIDRVAKEDATGGGDDDYEDEDTRDDDAIHNLAGALAAELVV